MSSLVIVGAQWGDEGKGKLVDYFTSNAQWSVRFNGGNNAGHTIVIGATKVKLSLVPSGILRPNCRCLIGAGLVVNGSVLLAEMNQLREAGVEVTSARLHIDRNAQLILPHHIAIDQQREARKAAAKIGTTGRGIGPAYEDRAARCGVRLVEFTRTASVKEKIRGLVEDSNLYLASVLQSDVRLEFETIWDEMAKTADALLPHMVNGSKLLDEAIKRDEIVVFEGAQGALLDPVFGTVPYVTSSHTLAGSIGTGCGIGAPSAHVLGVAKAYCTRVGAGPFPTELLDESGDKIRTAGAEFGTVTGRPRRCGWFDAAAMRYTARINGLTSVALTKLDILSGFDTIRVGIGYRLNGVLLDDFPALSAELEEAQVVYKDFKGWSEDISGAKQWSDLPRAARDYVDALEDLIGCPIGMVSVSPDRDATLYRKPMPELAPFIGSSNRA